MAKEIWVDNIEYRPELYSISSYGRIKNKKTNKFLKTRIHPDGYEVIEFGARPRVSRGRAYVHRLVFRAFNPDIEIIDYDIHHKDENKMNNHIDNLELIKKSDHCSKHAKSRIGKRAPNFKGTVAAFDKNTGELCYLLNGRKEMEQNKFWHAEISKVLSGKRESYKGYIFKRLDPTKSLDSQLKMN
jgi:hypothetical protein